MSSVHDLAILKPADCGVFGCSKNARIVVCVGDEDGLHSDRVAISATCQSYARMKMTEMAAPLNASDLCKSGEAIYTGLGKCGC